MNRPLPLEFVLLDLGHGEHVVKHGRFQAFKTLGQGKGCPNHGATILSERGSLCVYIICSW